MTAKLSHTWVTAQELFHPHHQLWVGFCKHPFKAPIFWGRFLENSNSHCPSQGSSWRIPANPALAAPPCTDKSWGVSKPWELLTWQIYECFLSQEMFAGWDSPELGFPLFIFPSDLLIRADNGNSTVLVTSDQNQRENSVNKLKNWCWWSKVCLKNVRQSGKCQCVQETTVKTSKNMLKWILMDA